MALVNAKCTNCGGDIQLDDTKKTGFCLHCGTKVSVEEAVKMVKIDNSDSIGKFLKLARNADNSGNNEETEKYCNMILEIDNNNAEIWFLKGKAVGWQTTLANNRLSEMVTAFMSGIECVENDEKELKIYSDKMCAELISICRAIIDLVCNNFSKHVSASNVSDYTTQISKMISTVYPLGIVLSRNLDTNFDIDLINNYAAIKGNSAACAGWKAVQADFGPGKDDMNRYAWERFVKEGDFCLDFLQTALILSKDLQTCKRIVENYIYINNTIKDSCSYKYNITEYGSYYGVDYTLTKAAKQARVAMNEEMTQKLEEKVKEMDREKRKYYRENPEVHKKDIDEKKKILKETAEEMNKNNKEKEKINKKIDELEDERDNLGIFKLSERKEIKNKIKAEEAKIAELDSKNSSLNVTLTDTRTFLEKFEDLDKYKDEIDDEDDDEYEDEE